MAALCFKYNSDKLSGFTVIFKVCFLCFCLIWNFKGCEGGVVVYDEGDEGEGEKAVGAAVPFLGPSLFDRLMGAHATPTWHTNQFYQAKDNQFADDGFKMATDGKGFKRGDVLVSWGGEDTGSALSWPQWQLPLLLSLVALAAGLAISFVILIWLKNQMSSSEKGRGEGEGCEGGGSGESIQWICHPVIKPTTTPQCDNLPQEKHPHHAGESKKDTVKIRAKGLLERRGSSASLTIDLMHPSQENITVTPTRECTTEEYLLSLGNVMSRQQLRACLRDVRALHREFWDLPLNHPDKVNVPGSWAKNRTLKYQCSLCVIIDLGNSTRYRTVIPNEATRVHLPSDPSSADNPTGYINANYVKGYDGEEKAFIATQGPLTHTVIDFWTMVWAEKAPVIVMITKLWEKARSKCEPYFPTEVEANAIYGEFVVTVMSVHNKDGYIMRHLQIQKNDETRKLVHFWFDSWPDHKTPPNAHSLLSLAKEVEIARFQGVPQRRLSAAWLSSPPSLKDTTSPVLTLGTLELKQEEPEIETKSYPVETHVEAINIEMWKSSDDLRTNIESSPSKKRTRQSEEFDHVRNPGQRFFKSPLPQDGSAFKFSCMPHASMPTSPHVARIDMELRSKSEECGGHDWEDSPAFSFDDPKDDDLRKHADSVFWRFEKLSTNSTGSYDTAQSPSWQSFEKSGKLSVDSPNWTAQTSPNLTGSDKSPRTNSSFDSPAFTISSSGSKRWPHSSDSKNWTQSSGDSSVWTASEDSPRCWEDVPSPPKPPVSPGGLLSPRWLEGNKGSPAGPVIVHCSAGIGRTGCFIAICIGVNQLLGENCVDILGIVCRMRNDRGGMVQTAEQYEFIHRALALFEKSLPDQSGE